MTYEYEYEVEVASINSADISDVCGSLEITHGRLIGGGYIEGREGQADAYVHFYAFPHPKGWEFRVATTAGDPAWEEADQAGFEELAASCGVNL